MTVPSSPLENVRIVLIATSHPGNIGAAARAMKTMGLSRLYLVDPKSFPDAEATSRASGADDVLAKAVVTPDLATALEGCTTVVGTSARLRSLSWPQLNPRECGERMIAGARDAEVALLFGRERSGLTNEELEQCRYLVHIPSNPEYSSLNIAAAVQVLCYELAVSAQLDELPLAEHQREVGDGDAEMATADDTERFYQHLETTLVDIDFMDPKQPRQLMRRLRRLFNRVELRREEVNILRGILSSAQRQASLAAKDKE